MVRFDVLESLVWKKFLFCNSSVYEFSTFEFRVFVCGYIQDVFCISVFQVFGVGFWTGFEGGGGVGLEV